ncbi:hypothetical protein BDFG_09489 [Blastomyces dermatitidis ATCC 26199]|nr:hypothetical protein BDFG_09489 [Blastomyces dermatitidis ATCC 26199]
MVNLRSGETPDLTQEYISRRQDVQKTPENQTPEPSGPLPTPVMSRKAAPEAFEPVEETIDESNELNNKYKDSVGDAMSDNAGGPSGQSDNTSEETRMKLDIARLMLEVEQLKAGRSESSASNEDISADLTNYLQQKGRTSAIVKILSEFRDQVRPIKKPVILTGSVNYPMWKEEILLAARQSETDDILNDRQVSPDEGASMDMQHFWSE